ncbi:MAG: toxin FitB [Bacteroidota bacterium]|nr:toxin FitB [Bacteroidota bacterium]
MNIIDSSFWIEYFANSIHSKHIEGLLKNPQEILVPAITLTEVYKKVLYQASKLDALIAISPLLRLSVIYADEYISLKAAELGREFKLPLADSIIYTTTLK